MHIANLYYTINLCCQVWIGWLISIIVFIGCIKLLFFITNKYLNDDSRFLNSSLSDVSMYIMAGLSNHGKQLH